VSPNDKNLKRQHSHRSAAITTYTIQMLDRSTSAITSVTKTRGLNANYLCEICLLKDTVHHICEKVIFSYMIATKFQTILHIYISTALSKNITYSLWPSSDFSYVLQNNKTKKETSFRKQDKGRSYTRNTLFYSAIIASEP
jgi:hypothetical protein